MIICGAAQQSSPIGEKMLISQLAKITNSTKDTIRHYEQLGLLICSQRQAGSRVYKEYAEENIEIIQTIKNGKFMGFSLKELTVLVKTYIAGGYSAEQQVSLFSHQLALIDKKLKELSEVKNYIEQKIKHIERQNKS
jgi:MerR family Zn(II)-responsive transcriptional regulator of zntA